MSEEEGGAPDTQPITVEVGTEIVNSVTNELVKAVTLVYGVDPMTASSMGGAFGGAAKGLAARAQQAYERRRQRALVALGAAREESGLEREELLERALEDDRKLELLTRAVETAMREADERRVRFYGRIAASGVLAEDDAKVDASERIFSTIANLDTVDLKVLLHMTAREPTPWLVVEHEGVHDLPVLAADLPELEEMLDPVLSRLLGLGLLTDRLGNTSYGDAHVVSPFARLCVEQLLRTDPVEG